MVNDLSWYICKWQDKIKEMSKKDVIKAVAWLERQEDSLQKNISNLYEEIRNIEENHYKEKEETRQLINKLYDRIDMLQKLKIKKIGGK